MATDRKTPGTSAPSGRGGTGKTTPKPKAQPKPKLRAEASARDRKMANEEAADLARGANGLSEFNDAQEAVQGVMKAQMEAMNTMMTASMNASMTSLRAMAQFWTAAVPKKDAGKKD